MMRPKVKKQYPSKKDIKKKPCKDQPTYAKAINCVIAGIWHDYSDKTKKRLIREYEGTPPKKKSKAKKRKGGSLKCSVKDCGYRARHDGTKEDKGRALQRLLKHHKKKHR